MKKFSIGKKMYIFAVATVLIVAVTVCVLNYEINAGQIDDYFMRLTMNTSQYYATQVDVEFLKKLREVAESEEYQKIREKAAEEESELEVIDYLKGKGLWDKYQEERNKMIDYIENMTDVEYLYLIVWGDKDSERDMYLLDADDVPVYETGYYELREAEFAGVDPTDVIEPVINNGDWGWLCSGYAPVFDEDGNVVCHVGCDVNMENIVNERRLAFSYMILSAVVCAIFVLIGAIVFVNRVLISPIKKLTGEMKRFTPGEGRDYQEAGVMELDIKNHDEIKDLYDEIRSMQIRITDYIDNISEIKHKNEIAESVLKHREKEIGEISEEAYKDQLTGVGNKNSYSKKVERLGSEIKKGSAEFAVVMVDVNRLKYINDTFGHTAGDTYLIGSCHAICEVFKKSPVYRVGGDEFVVILQGDDYNDREKKMDILRKSFEDSYDQKNVDPWFRYSASAGVSEYKEGDTFETVFKRADELMYAAKQEFKKLRS